MSCNCRARASIFLSEKPQKWRGRPNYKSKLILSEEVDVIHHYHYHRLLLKSILRRFKTLIIPSESNHSNSCSNSLSFRILTCRLYFFYLWIAHDDVQMLTCSKKSNESVLFFVFFSCFFERIKWTCGRSFNLVFTQLAVRGLRLYRKSRWRQLSFEMAHFPSSWKRHTHRHTCEINRKCIMSMSIRPPGIPLPQAKTKEIDFNLGGKMWVFLFLLSQF